MVAVHISGWLWLSLSHRLALIEHARLRYARPFGESQPERGREKHERANARLRDARSFGERASLRESPLELPVNVDWTKRLEIVVFLNVP